MLSFPMLLVALVISRKTLIQVLAFVECLQALKSEKGISNFVLNIKEALVLKLLPLLHEDLPFQNDGL